MLTLIILGTLILAVRKHVTNTLVVETTRLFFNELMIFFFFTSGNQPVRVCFCHSFCVVINTNLVYYHYYCCYSFQRLTCLEFWHMIKQHYGQELGLTHEEMESLQIQTESSMQTRWPSTQRTHTAD